MAFIIAICEIKIEPCIRDIRVPCLLGNRSIITPETSERIMKFVRMLICQPHEYAR